MKYLCAIPALPVRDIEAAAAFYRDKLGFHLRYFNESGYAVLCRDAVEIHLWAATDEAWRARDGSAPVVSGAESFLAGTASCRISVEGVDEWHQQIQPLNIIHPNGPLRDTDFGTREFAVLDPDNNLITFFERIEK